LGRGLEALLGRPAEGSPDGNQAPPWGVVDGTQDAGGGGGDGMLYVNVYELDSNPFQPRREFNEDELTSLSESIKQHGLIQPLVVRRAGDRFQLVAGERRLRAAIKAGWAEVPVQLLEVDDRQAAELALVENLHREDLNPLEKAAAFQQYLQRYQCTQEELAGRLQCGRSTVANLIRLLELPEGVQQAVRGGNISEGHARALLPLGDEREQLAFCQRIQSEGLSVRATEGLVRETINQTDREPLSVVSPEGETATPRTRSEHLASLEQEFRSALGTKVEVKEGGKGRGKIVVHFNSHEEFERLRSQLCGHPQNQQPQDMQQPWPQSQAS
jgi:ParB family chromosome partitioning protein